MPSPHENDDMKAEPDNEPSSDQSPDNSSNHPLPGKNPQTRPQHENSDPSPSPPAKQPSLNFPPPPSDISGVQITIPEKNDTPPPAVEGSKPPEWITGLFKPSNTGNLPPMHENQSHTVDTGPPASTATDSKNDNQPDTEQKQKSFPSWLIPSNTSPDEDKNKKSNVKGDNADEEKDSKTNTIITSVAIFIAVAVAIGFISTTIRKTSVKRKRFQGRLADIDQPSINPTALFGSEPTPNYATYDESLPLPSKEYKTYTPNQHNYSQSTVYHHSDYSQNLSPHHQKVSTPQHAKYDYDDDRIFYSRDEHHP